MHEHVASKQRARREAVRSVITKTRQKTSAEKRILIADSERQRRAHAMALAYEERLGLYQRNPTLRYLKKPPRPGDRTFTTWERAAAQADALGISYARYVQAQFYYFHEWFRRAPRPYELASYKTYCNAMERARMFEREASRGSVDASQVQTTPVRASAPVTRGVRLHRSDQQMQVMMKNFGVSEEKILRAFAVGATAHLYFDPEWLAKNETYQQLKREGVL